MRFKVNKLIWLLFIVSIIGTIFVYPKLPSNIPIHWDSEGNVDNQVNRVFVFLIGALPLAVYLLYTIRANIDPKKQSYAIHKKGYQMLITFLMLLMMVAHWISIISALGYKINVAMIILSSGGILLVVIGNYMRQIRHNYSYGIRNQWTLANEKVWTKAHRLGSTLTMIGGIITIILGLMDINYASIIILAYLGGSAILLRIYSYLQFKEQKII